MNIIVMKNTTEPTMMMGSSKYTNEGLYRQNFTHQNHRIPTATAHNPSHGTTSRPQRDSQT